MLNAEEFKAKLNEVLESAGDPGKVSLILTDLHANYGEALTVNGELAQTAAKLKESNESLVKSNGELFRYVGMFKEPEKEPEKEEPKQSAAADLKSIDEVMESLLPTWK